MKTLIKIIFIVLALAYNFATFAYSNSPDTSSYKITSITISAEPDYPPYCIIDKNGNPDGFAIDLFKAAAKAVNIDVTIKIGVWNQIKQDLADGKIDALPFMGRTPEREPYFDFSLPYISLHGAIFVKKRNNSITSFDELKNKRLGVLQGDNAEEYARRVNLSNNIITTNTFEEAFRMLNNGEVDAVIAQRVMGLNLLKLMNLNTIAPLEVQMPSFRQDFCFAVKKGDSELISRLNEGLSIVIANKTFDEIHLKWFGPSIKEGISTKDFFQIAIKILIPLIIILALVLIILLRRVVKVKTISLQNEIRERHKTNLLLIRQQQLLEEMEMVSKVGGWEYNVESKKVTWTKGVYDIYGVFPNEFDPSNPISDIQFYHPDDQATINSAFKRAIENGEPYNLDLRLITPVGVQKWVRTSGQAELSNGIIVRLFGYIMDTTESKIAEEKLKVAASDWQTTFDSSKDAIWLMDKDNLILRANKTSENLFNNKKDGLIGKHCWEVVHGTCEPLTNCPVANIKQSLSREIGEFKIGNRLYEIILDPIIDQNGEYNGAVHSIYDKTENRKAEEALKEQEEIFRHFMEHSPIYVFFKDENIRPVILSKNYEQMLNKPLDELLGKSMDDLFPSDLAKAMIADDQKILAEGKTITVDEEFNGRYYTTIKFPIIIDGKPRYLAGYTIDITENKKSERELLELKNKLEVKVVERTQELEVQLQKLDKSQKAMLYMVEDLNSMTRDLVGERKKLEISNKELEAFSYSVSHDLRAPLRHINGYVELLNKHFNSILPEKGQHYIASITNSVHSMGNLIDDLLQFSRMGRNEMLHASIEMSEIVLEVKESVCKQNPDRNIEWVLGELPTVIGDRAMLQLVWINLINNAVKFTGKRKKAKIEIGVLDEKTEWIFFIEDNGVGFDMQYVHKLFGVFQRLHPSDEFEGTGIGLANVQRIVLRHGGRAWAEGEIDKGAKIFFSLHK